LCVTAWWTIFYSSLPLLLVVCSMCLVFSFCDDHQFIGVSRCEKSSWSTRWWRFRCLVIWTWALLILSFFRAMAHVLAYLLKSLFDYCWTLYLVLFWHQGVSWILWGVMFILQDCATILLCVTPLYQLNGVLHFVRVIVQHNGINLVAIKYNMMVLCELPQHSVI